jgi:hypothetical protein
MEIPDKFTGLSRFIDIPRLERQSRRVLYLGFLFAIIFHSLLGIFISFKEPFHREKPIAEKPEKPIPLEIIVIPPRNLEPFKIKERRFVKKIIQRGDRIFCLPSRGIDVKEPFPIFSIQEIPLPKANPGIEEEKNLRDRFLDSISSDIGVPWGSIDSIPIRRDTGPDPGMFRSDIIYNPANKLAIQGYVHIPLITIDDMEQTDKFILSLRGLVAGINLHTNITAVFDNPQSPIKFQGNFLHIREISNQRGISVDSLYVFRPPLVYFLADRAFQFSEAERRSIQMYLMGGGMLIMENAKPGDETLRSKLRSLMISLLEYTIFHPSLEPIPRNHPIYHCFYDFGTGPPEGAGQELGALPHKVLPYLEGMFYRGKLLAVFSDRGYGLCWGAEGRYEKQVKMGVNLVVYALIQPGSIAQQYADYPALNGSR